MTRLRSLTATAGCAIAIAVAAPAASADTSSHIPSNPMVDGPPMTSTGLDRGQETTLLSELFRFRESVVGTQEWVNCATLPLARSIPCTILDAVAPVVILSSVRP
ncbi:hypothetical protein [Corynebacterium pacaense]|uniref:hypothetical protein n=1 Tax=Corynebacterium pacaense TaxID=1816684 RepID=UPI0009BB65E4|nr:hypothetical protein [Corynebacterium pacaense]